MNLFGRLFGCAFAFFNFALLAGLALAPSPAAAQCYQENVFNNEQFCTNGNGTKYDLGAPMGGAQDTSAEGVVAGCRHLCNSGGSVRFELHWYEVAAGGAYCNIYSGGTLLQYQFAVRDCGPGFVNSKNLGQPENTCPVTNPINPATGNKFQVETDYVGPGAVPLRFARYYNSIRKTGASMGTHWRHFYERSLVFYPNASVPAVAVYRPDGRIFYFNQNGGDWLADADVTGRLTADGSGWAYTQDDIVESYDANGRLLALTHRNGTAQALTYDAQGRLERVTDSFGRQLQLGYDTSGRVSGLVDPAGQAYAFEYNANNALTFARYPGSIHREYRYTNATFPLALTKIIDENGDEFATWTYDAAGRANSSSHAGGADQASLTYNATGTTTVTDAFSTSRTYEFDTTLGVSRVKKVNGPASHCGNAAETAFGGDGFVTQKKDFNGNITTYTHNARGLEESRTEAYGTPLARTITTQWHPTFRVPTQIDEPGRRTVYTYDAATGDRLTQTVTDLATSESRTTTWTYTTFGRVLTVDGPRTDVSDVTTYEYYSCTTGAECGQVHTITNPVGHVTTITSYNAHGNPLAIVDANGVSTVLSYDPRQRLKTRTVGGVMTTIDYDGAGQLDKVTLPGGAFLDYTYDAAHRLIEIEDNLGNRIHYTVDLFGNRTKEEVFDPADVLKRAQSQVFNTLGRLEQIKNAAGTVATEYGYDAQGNRTSQLDYSAPTTSHATTFMPDALNRIKQVTDAASGVTQYGYNALDQLTSVTDPKSLITSYTVNALGDVKQQVSPDTGTTQYPIHDGAGNRKRQIDARGVQVDYAYDALNRLTFVDYPEDMGVNPEDVTYSYDSAAQPYGKGRLTGIIDESGTTVLIYDARGNVTEERRTIEGSTYVTGYSYDAADRLISIAYPTGRIVTYERNNALGQVTRVTTTVSGVTTTVADNIAYMPFGGIKGYTLGNGVAVTRSHDLDYRLDEIKDQGAALVQDVRLYYDLRGNIDVTEDLVIAGRSQAFGYDGLSRLTTAEGLYGMRGYTYDGVGNRLTETVTPPGGSAVTDIYTYPSSSHRLSSITGGNPTSFTHDDAGNVIEKDGLAYGYNAAGRLNGFDSSFTNAYNAAGQRVTASKGEFVFHYDREGHLLVEIEAFTPRVMREYVWLGDLPLSLDGEINEPDIVVDNTDPGFSPIGTWSSSTTASGYYGADYQVRAAGTISGTQLLDNGASGTTKSGTWQTRTTPAGFYGANFERSSQVAAQYSWSLPVTAPGEHKVYVRYPSDSTFRSKANYQVTFAGGSQTYEVDQRSGGGAWRLLGTHSFTTSAQITLTVGAGSAGTYLVADAVKIVPVNSEYASWSVPEARTYDVYARWPASVTHSAQAVYRIVHAGGTTDVVHSQQYWGDFWAYLGTFEFSDTVTQSVVLLADENWAVAADAVMFRPAYGTSPTRKAYYHLDHLGTPQKLTDVSQSVVWDASYEPFGEASLLAEGMTQPLRFPGQYFDAETGLHQNWHRDYDPSIGRYLQSDPIGLRGGLSTYGYVLQNPMRYKDPQGLEVGAAYSAVYHADQAPSPSPYKDWGPSKCSYYAKQCQNDGCSQDAYACNAQKCCESFGDNSSSNCTRKCLIETDQAECAALDGDERNKCRFRAHVKCYASCGNVNDLVKRPWSQPACKAAMEGMGGVSGGYIKE